MFWYQCWMTFINHSWTLKLVCSRQPTPKGRGVQKVIKFSLSWGLGNDSDVVVNILISHAKGTSSIAVLKVVFFNISDQSTWCRLCCMLFISTCNILYQPHFITSNKTIISYHQVHRLTVCTIHYTTKHLLLVPHVSLHFFIPTLLFQHA